MICQARNERSIETREIQTARRKDKEPENLAEIIFHGTQGNAEYLYMNKAQLSVLVRELQMILGKM